MILLTTSRRPTERMRSFCRELAYSFPDVLRVNRGKMSLDGVAEKAIELGAERAVVVDRRRGQPGAINLFQVTSSGLKPELPVILVGGVRLRREFNVPTRRIRASVITYDSKDYDGELEKLVWKLSQFFGLPSLPVNEVSGEDNLSFHVSFESSRCLKLTFVLLERMIEIGPRVSVSKLIWEALP